MGNLSSKPSSLGIGVEVTGILAEPLPTDGDILNDRKPLPLPTLSILTMGNQHPNKNVNSKTCIYIYIYFKPHVKI
jgi:hypothetical protein